jgi:ABC-type glycerol-3-phosphate transport system substrate-binding protein
LASEGLIKDITDLLPTCAGNYYSLLQEKQPDKFKYFTCQGKLYAVPNNGLSHSRYCVIARKDLVDKYLKKPIENLEDYQQFLKKVRENEKELLPGCVFSNQLVDAYMTGNGYLQNMVSTFYNTWNSKEFNIIPMEQTPEFETAYYMYKKWSDDKLIINSPDKSLNNENFSKLASLLSPIEYIRQSFAKYIVNEQKYFVYPLYMNKTYLKRNDLNSLAIGINSPDCEQALRFIEWLNSSQENYDLFKYGIKDKHYIMNGSFISFPFPDEMEIIDWWGSYVFTNYILEHPRPYEPENYSEFLEECALKNTITYDEVLEKFGMQKYDEIVEGKITAMEDQQKVMEEIFEARWSILRSFWESLDGGDFRKTPKDLKEELISKGTDRILEYYSSLLKELKAK